MISRILPSELETVPVDALRLHPRNPRQGDVEAIRASIGVNGFYGAVVAQRSTGYVVAGNHRLLAAKAAGLEEVPVLWIDVSDEEAARILVADNRTSDLGGYDDATLAELLQSLASTDLALAGTGYSAADLADLLEAPAAAEPVIWESSDLVVRTTFTVTVPLAQAPALRAALVATCPDAVFEEVAHAAEP